ncbi:MAG: hypothetical protein WBQ76_07650 [Candidatus Korobacteraceae bacterium]
MELKYRQRSIEFARIAHPYQLSQMRFFDVGPYVDGSTCVTEFTEKQLICWVMGFEPARQLLFEELGFFGSDFYKCAVEEPFYSPGKGDIDLVICRWQAPQEAAAIEFKRVKITVDDPEHHQLNKLEETYKGVEQANRLHESFRFYQTYLAIMIAIEASSQEDTNIPCRGIDPAATPDYGQTKTFKRIVEFPGREELQSDIGIVFFEVVQPSRISIDRRVTLRICVHHPSQRRTQSDSVTNQIEMLLRGTRGG